MSSSSLSLCSISKHFGAAMSSRLIPPKEGAIAFTAAIISSGSCTSNTIGTESMPAKCLNSKDLPSITGMAPSGPISPKPNTADPSDMTATRLFVHETCFSFS